MYLKYFNLHTRPFKISPDPKFLWLGEKHKEGLATLKYGIMTNKGLISLTGDVGTGKTTLLNALAQSFDQNYIFARIPDPSLEELDFFNFAARAFELNKTFENKGDFLKELSTFLNNVYSNGREVILIVDEAQRIKQKMLEEIRLIANIENSRNKLMNIIFSGHNNFDDIINQNEALRSRLAINYKIDPLTEIDTEKYINHRLRIAGSKTRIFSSSAIHEIYSYSKGNPRQINIICDLALLFGYTAGTKKIEPATIKESVKRTLIPTTSRDPVAEYQEIHTTVALETDQEPPIEDSKKSRRMVFDDIKGKFRQHRVAYLVPVPVLIVLVFAGLFFYPGSHNSSIVNLKTYFKQAVGRVSQSIFDTPVQNMQRVNEPAIIQTVPTPDNQTVSLPQAKFSQDGIQREIAMQAAMIKDLQSKLQTAQADQAALADDFKALKNAKALVARLKDELAAKERMLQQSSQRQQELQKVLEQEKGIQNQSKNELTANAAMIADLKNRLKMAQQDQTALETQLQKSQQEKTALQTQLKALDEQKTSTEEKLKDLQQTHDSLAADSKELENTKTLVAKMKEELTVKEQVLAQTQQRLQDLEKLLAQEKKNQHKYNSELTTQAARVLDLQNKLEAARADQAGLGSQLRKSQQKATALQAQLKELDIQKASSEAKLVNLEAERNSLTADSKELSTTKELLTALKNELSVKDQMLTQSQQRQQKLEKNLAQEKNNQYKLNSELSEQAALIIDLQNKLESATTNQAALEDEINRSMKKTAQLLSQVQELKSKTTVPPPKQNTADMPAQPPPQPELTEEEAESPDPSDIIDWVLQKKTE